MFFSSQRRVRGPQPIPSSIIAFIVKLFNYFCTCWLSPWDWAFLEGRSFIFFIFLSPEHDTVFGIPKAVSRWWNNRNVELSMWRYLAVAAWHLVWSLKSGSAEGFCSLVAGVCHGHLSLAVPALHGDVIWAPSVSKNCNMPMIRGGEEKIWWIRVFTLKQAGIRDLIVRNKGSS